jgi:hypothetical protein
MVVERRRERCASCIPWRLASAPGDPRTGAAGQCDDVLMDELQVGVLHVVQGPAGRWVVRDPDLDRSQVSELVRCVNLENQAGLVDGPAFAKHLTCVCRCCCAARGPVLGLVLWGLQAAIPVRNRCLFSRSLILALLLGSLVLPAMAQQARVPQFGTRLTTEDVDAVRSAGLIPLLVPVETSEVRKQNAVISIQPDRGSLCTPGTTVRIEYYIASVAVPNVAGKRRAAATASIQRAGLACSLAYGSDREGRVTSQDPVAGTRLPTARSITVAPHGTVFLMLKEALDPPPSKWPRVVIYILAFGVAGTLLYALFRRLIPRRRATLESVDMSPAGSAGLGTSMSLDGPEKPDSEPERRQPVPQVALSPTPNEEPVSATEIQEEESPAADQSGNTRAAEQRASGVQGPDGEIQLMLKLLNAAIRDPEREERFRHCYAPRHAVVVRNATGDVVSPAAPALRESNVGSLLVVQFGRSWRLVPDPSINKYTRGDLDICFDCEAGPPAEQLLVEVLESAIVTRAGTDWILRRRGKVWLAETE